MWDSQSALIYDTLTEAVEDSDEEEFNLEVEAYAYGSVDQLFGIEGEVIIVPSVSIYEVEHSVNWTRMESCMTEALDRLLANGEISDVDIATGLAMHKGINKQQVEALRAMTGL